MNSKRRKELASIAEALAELQVRLESVIEDEQEAYDNMPEGLQMSERGESMDEGIGILNDVSYSLQEAAENLNSML